MPAEIVAADDDETIREVLRYELGKTGFDVTIHKNGVDCWAHLQEAGDLPELVILDRMMPGLDGVQVVRRIRDDESMTDLPIIMLTSRGREEDVVSGFDAGVDDYVIKPFSPNELRSRIRRALAQ